VTGARPRLALLAAAAVGVQVGLATVASRFAIAETTPAALALMRYAIGAACLAPAALVLARTRFTGGDLAPIAILGIVQFGVLIALLNYGLQTIPAGRAALILATFPLLTMLFAAAIGHEHLTMRKSLGVLLTVAGVAVALAEKIAGAGPASADWRGEAAVLVAAAAGAVCSVLYRPYLRRYSALAVGTIAMLASVAALALPATLEGFLAHPPQFSSPAWAAIAFIGVSSGIGYFLWLWALANASPTRVTIFMSLSPLTAGLVGALLLGEPLSWYFATGLAAVIAGLWLGTRPEVTPGVHEAPCPPVIR
jgi:drug/metabolite transporter (DMT)-like permease